MKREHWKALLPLIEAFANGEDVEFHASGRWGLLNGPDFTSAPERYRIAPKPKTGWINIYSDRRSGKVYETRKDADDYATSDRIACIQITYKEGDGL